eukprot:7715723-Pyramimonas_sp.AAC.1
MAPVQNDDDTSSPQTPKNVEFDEGGGEDLEEVGWASWSWRVCGSPPLAPPRKSWWTKQRLPQQHVETPEVRTPYSIDLRLPEALSAQSTTKTNSCHSCSSSFLCFPARPSAFSVAGLPSTSSFLLPTPPPPSVRTS